MFKSYRIATVMGIPLTLHWSFLLVAAYIVASAFSEGGLASAAESALFLLMVFGSVTAHEFGHILVARAYGIGTSGINLSAIGGIAFLERQHETPLARTLVALGGPAVSLVLAASFFAWAHLGYGAGGPQTPMGDLFVINAVLLLFNLLPVYPLDGGQVLKACAEAAFGKAVSDSVALWTGRLAGLAMAGIGFWYGIVSLTLIGAFIYVMVSLEYGIPLFGIRRPKKGEEAPDEDRSAASSLPDFPRGGIFVAFDGEGRHFAYAKHWLDAEGGDEEQLRTIAAYEKEAVIRGGHIRLLSQEEYRKIVVTS